jgi:hypothetical protein
MLRILSRAGLRVAEQPIALALLHVLLRSESTLGIKDDEAAARRF